MPIQPVAFDPASASRIADVVRQFEGRPLNGPARKQSGPRITTPDMQVIRVTSDTQGAHGWPGQIQTITPDHPSYQDLNDSQDCWIQDINGRDLAAGKYLARRIGPAPDELSWFVTDTVVADGGGDPPPDSGIKIRRWSYWADPLGIPPNTSDALVWRLVHSPDDSAFLAWSGDRKSVTLLASGLYLFNATASVTFQPAGGHAIIVMQSQSQSINGRNSISPQYWQDVSVTDHQVVPDGGLRTLLSLVSVGITDTQFGYIPFGYLDIAYLASEDVL